MSESGHDIQVCLRKTLKLLSQTCASFTLKHPVLFFSTLSVFLLYVAFPFAFWVLVYSVPLVVCTAILILSLNSGPSHDTTKNKRPITRVHSVRRRRAKEFARDEGKDKTDISTTSVTSPKDIRDLEVVLVRGCSKSSSLWEERKEVAGDNIVNKAEEEDHHEKNKMDVVISDSETTKRLESLIARRRLRKLLSIEVRRRNLQDQQQMSSFAAMPKINNMSRLVIPSRGVGLGGGPVPGSAPSVMIQTRNPFDLPYDPQEEKPDLTGDSFGQEFRMFCRHESFTLRPFLPGEFSRSLKEISDEDQIKEIIRVHENSSEEGEGETDIETTAEDQARRHVITSDSVASDMQVEVSELSSPPLTIDENLSYVYNDEYERVCDHPWCSIASCRDDDDSMKEYCAHRLNKSEENNTSTSRHDDQGRLSNEWRDSVEQGIRPPEGSRETGQNEQQERIEGNSGNIVEVNNDGSTEPSDLTEVGEGSPSPKSVLHTTCSLASFDNDYNIDEEVRADRVLLSPVEHGSS